MLLSFDFVKVFTWNYKFMYSIYLSLTNAFLVHLFYLTVCFKDRIQITYPNIEKEVILAIGESVQLTKILHLHYLFQMLLKLEYSKAVQTAF